MRPITSSSRAEHRIGFAAAAGAAVVYGAAYPLPVQVNGALILGGIAGAVGGG
jgi:hypothetical protein